MNTKCGRIEKNFFGVSVLFCFFCFKISSFDLIILLDGRSVFYFFVLLFKHIIFFY